jgi:hypothetical protein
MEGDDDVLFTCLDLPERQDTKIGSTAGEGIGGRPGRPIRPNDSFLLHLVLLLNYRYTRRCCSCLHCYLRWFLQIKQEGGGASTKTGLERLSSQFNTYSCVFANLITAVPMSSDYDSDESTGSAAF